MDLYKSMLAPKSKCYVYIVSMTVPTHLMDVYIAIYIRNKCHLCTSEKLYFYTVYIAVILLLDSCMEATICRKKDSACMLIALSPERG